MKAAIEISTLLARSFFMGFSMTVLALLARLRVLTQQILLDVVSVFNMVSSLSQKQQSVKLNQEGIEVFREYYPKNEQEVVFLECVWENDKFILQERKSEPDNKILETRNDDVICEGLSTVEYQSIETILGAEKPVDIIQDKPSEKDAATIKTDGLSSIENLTHDCKQVNNQIGEKDDSYVSESSSKNQEHEHITNLNLLDHSDSLKPNPELKKKVAFVSVKRPEPLRGNDTGVPIKLSDEVNGEKKDPLFSLLSEGIE